MFLNKCGYVIHHFNVHFLIFGFFFFAHDSLLAVYFIFILDYRNDVGQKSDSRDFFYLNSKWVIKQQGQLTTSTVHLAQELPMNIQHSAGSRNFAEEIKALKMRSIAAGHWKLTTTNWEQSSKLILLQLHEKLPKNSMLTILQSFSIWSKLERWKSSINGCLMSWQEIKKNVVLKCCLLLSYATTMKHFSIRLWCAMKSGFYITTSNDQLGG